jgi:magnesium chelatase accessory protein
MSGRLSWEDDGRDWPNRAASRFVAAGGLRWHVQVLGAGPVLLLVHGTGAATHSWRDLAPLLAAHFTVVAPDLPGHGFSDTPRRETCSLPGMVRALRALLDALGLEPVLAVGHSAGAAILARASLDGLLALRSLVSVNGALLPLAGLPGRLFSPLARLLAASPLVPRLFAGRAADRKAVERLIRSTGSRLDERGVELYARLVRNPVHVAGALCMMAHWDLAALHRDLGRLQVPLLLVVGDHDLTVRPSRARRVLELVPHARALHLPGLGHLAHEERPEAVAEAIVELARAGAVL